MEKVDPITTLEPENRELLEKYVKPFLAYEGNPVGAAQVLGTLAHSIGAQSLAGWQGIADAIIHRDAGHAADAVKSTSEALGPHSLGESGQRAIREGIAPIYRGVKDSPAGGLMSKASDFYDQGVNQDADLIGKYFGNTAGGVTQAAGALAPMMINPEGAEAKAAATTHLPGVFKPLLEDGATRLTLEREAAANARRAQDGITTTEVPTSDFAGRQAEHEGAVARRMNEKAPRQISVMSGADSHLAGSIPDDANVYTSTHPETGEMQGYAVTVPRTTGHQMTDMMVYPAHRRQGIGKDLFNRAVGEAHDAGLPFHSDTSVTPEQMANVHHSGHSIELNPATEEGDGPYGMALKSSNGQPVYTIPPPSAAEDAHPDDAMPGSWIKSQAYAKGGLAMSSLEDMIAKYAKTATQIAETGGATVHPHSMETPTHGFAVSVHKGREAVLPAAPTAEDLHNYALQHHDVFSSDPGAHLGAWRDPESGQHFLDVSHVDTDFSSAVRKAQEAQQLGIFDLAHGDTVPTTPDYQHFIHYSNLDKPKVTLDPNKMGTGIRGAEARRGGPKVTSLYAADNAAPEQGLETKTPYRVSIPGASLYDMSADPHGFRSSEPSYSDAEAAVRDAGYAGYHAPDGAGILRGQARMFTPTEGTRLGPMAEQHDAVASFAEGGEVGTLLGGIGDLVKAYAPEADHIAAHVAEHGGITYHPSTGDVHGSGYIVPTHPKASVSINGLPAPDDIHNFLMDNQEAFSSDPHAVLHVHGDDDGNHFMHVGHLTPDYGDAADKAGAAGLPGFGDIATGDLHPASRNETPMGAEETPHPSAVEEHLQATRTPTPWTPGQQTVANPKRNAFPGVYNDPRQVIADATAKVGPEDPLMRQLFGVSRGDLSELALSRQGNELGILPGAKANPQGAAAARDVMTPANEQRLIDVLGEARKSPGLYQGMTGWYAMDPLYQQFVKQYGPELAREKYMQFNALTGMASPGSDVGTEIARGTSANWLHNEGRFQDFIKYGGGLEGGESHSRPVDMADLPGHVYHRTAQAIPMQQYLDSGSLQMKSPKVPMYIQASGVPETGFQTETPVGDAHWARGVGLADTRGTRTSKGVEIVPGSSVSTPEMQTLAPWWRHRIAGAAGLESVPAQALAWGAFSPYTGVKSAIGAPKLEILSTQIGKLAKRLGISPETARDLVVSGKAGAFRAGGSVG